MTAGAMLRWLRAWVVAVVALLTGVSAHVAGGGVPANPGVLLLLTMPVALICAPLLRREASTFRLVLLLVAGQAFIHGTLALTAVGHRASSPVIESSASLPASSHTGLGHAVGHGAGLPAVDHLDVTTLGVGMVLAHLAAAVLVGCWLRAGERAVWSLLALVAHPVAVAWRTLVEALRVRPGRVDNAPAGVTPAARGADRSRRLQRWLLCRAVTRRGPPSWCAV